MKDELSGEAARPGQYRRSILIFRESRIHRSRQTKRTSIVYSRTHWFVMKASIYVWLSDKTTPADWGAVKQEVLECVLNLQRGFIDKQGGFLLSTFPVSYPWSIMVYYVLPLWRKALSKAYIYIIPYCELHKCHYGLDGSLSWASVGNFPSQAEHLRRKERGAILLGFHSSTQHHVWYYRAATFNRGDFNFTGELPLLDLSWH